MPSRYYGAYGVFQSQTFPADGSYHTPASRGGRRNQRKGSLKADRRRRETMGSPKRGDPHGDRAAIVLKCLGQCPGHGEGPQDCGDVRDCAMDVANRKGIRSQGRLSSRSGEPDAVKAACPVREEAVGKGPSGDTTRIGKVLAGLRKVTVPRWPPTSCT